MSKTVKLDLDPCPCCGNTNLFVGAESSDTVAVVCWAYGKGCGLRMLVPYPDKMGRHKNLEALKESLARTAVRKWNRRRGK